MHWSVAWIDTKKYNGVTSKLSRSITGCVPNKMADILRMTFFQMHFRKLICFILIRLLSVKWTTCVIIEVIAWCHIGPYLSRLWLGSTTPYDVTCAQLVYWCYDWSFILTAGIYPDVISTSNDSIISSYLHVNHALSKTIWNWPSSNRISFYTRKLRHVLVVVNIKLIWIIFFISITEGSAIDDVTCL